SDGEPARMPSFAAPLVTTAPEPAAEPDFLEVAAESDYLEPAPAPPEYSEPPPLPGQNGAANLPEAVSTPPPLFTSAAGQATPAAATPVFDAAAKIAAEANATAEALENLKRLLIHSAPTPAAPQAMNLHGGPSPFADSEPGPLLPLPVLPGEGRSKRV